VLISRFFNQRWPTRDRGTTARLTFLGINLLLTLKIARKAARKREHSMTFVGRLSVVTAYLALAFVGAIVLGVI
jgi:hypothetical protein